MSFTTDVKEELCRMDINKQATEILKYGVSYGLKSLGQTVIYTESNIVFEFIKKHFAHNITEVITQERKNSCQHTIKFDDEISKLASETVIKREIVSAGDTEAGLFLRGVFIACGIISDPNKEYHFELSPGDNNKCRQLSDFINEHGMFVKLSARKGVNFLYTKESELISDLLTYIGATRYSMEIMNVKIYKGVRNNVNRAVNCDTANIAKTVNASQKQQEDIELIINRKGLQFLSDELREVALIRRDNVELSLREIGEMLNPKLSRSGVNHRLKRIGELAEDLRSSNG